MREEESAQPRSEAPAGERYRLPGWQILGRTSRTERRSITERNLLLAFGGLLVCVAGMTLFRLLGLSGVTYAELAVGLAVTAGVWAVVWLIQQADWDEAIPGDRDYVYLPMAAAALLFGLYIYLVPEARELFLMAWFVALLFVVGVAGGRGVLFLGVVMAASYTAAVLLRQGPELEVTHRQEAVRTGVFLLINAFAAGVFERIRRTREETRELREELGRQAVTDGLTGLRNRRYFEEYLEAELARLERYGGTCAVAMVDVDHFKNYNDTHGHLAGDAVLRELADILRSEARDSDVVARYGGEEFALIMPSTDGPRARQAMERMRRLVQGHDFPGEEVQPGRHLTVSAGVAVAPEHGDAVEPLMGEADRALYRAKREGRNRVRAPATEVEEVGEEPRPGA